MLCVCLCVLTPRRGERPAWKHESRRAQKVRAPNPLAGTEPRGHNPLNGGALRRDCASHGSAQTTVSRPREIQLAAAWVGSVFEARRV